jgi:hypothetical protein
MERRAIRHLAPKARKNCLPDNFSRLAMRSEPPHTLPMVQANHKAIDKARVKDQPVKPSRLVSAQFDDGTLVETLHDPVARTTSFCMGKDGQWTTADHIERDGQQFVPLPPGSNLLRYRVVLFPNHPEPYEGEAELLRSIRSYLHTWVDLSPLFEQIAAHYVLLSWVYDAFRELPYLRVRGDYGTGKTRFLLILGSICYKPIFTSGASTVSPLFRLLDSIQGTLILDEGDFRASDERAEIVKILNNGNAQGFPVLRSEATPLGEYEPRAYAVFGPKIVATRTSYTDRALESRFLTEELGGKTLRKDIPLNLDETYQTQSLALRNKLLTFRLQQKHRLFINPAVHDPSLEPRLNQVFAPLLSIITEPALLAEVRQLASQYQQLVRSERGQELPGQVVSVIYEMEQQKEKLSIKSIVERVVFHYGAEWAFPPSAKKIGHVIRERLNLRTERTMSGYCLVPNQEERLAYLYQRYGVEDAANEVISKDGAPTNLPI